MLRLHPLRQRYLIQYAFASKLNRFSSYKIVSSLYKDQRYMTTKNEGSHSKDQMYLHIAPCGDFWTDTEIFAAKHLQPDYVKSIPISTSLSIDLEEVHGSADVDLDSVLKEVYDTGDVSILEEVLDIEDSIMEDIVDSDDNAGK